MKLVLSDKMIAELIFLLRQHKHGRLESPRTCHHTMAWALFCRGLVDGGEKPDTLQLTPYGKRMAELLSTSTKEKQSVDR